jgi:hypothetical protein
VGEGLKETFQDSMPLMIGYKERGSHITCEARKVLLNYCTVRTYSKSFNGYKLGLHLNGPQKITKESIICIRK